SQASTVHNQCPRARLDLVPRPASSPHGRGIRLAVENVSISRCRGLAASSFDLSVPPFVMGSAYISKRWGVCGIRIVAGKRPRVALHERAMRLTGGREVRKPS